MNDEQLVASLAQSDPELAGVCADPEVRAVVRLAAMIASQGTCASYQSVINSALAAGASVEDVIGVLLAVAPTVGSVRVVAAAPLLARAVGFDVDAAFDRDQPHAPLARPQGPVRFALRASGTSAASTSAPSLLPGGEAPYIPRRSPFSQPADPGSPPTETHAGHHKEPQLSALGAQNQPVPQTGNSLQGHQRRGRGRMARLRISRWRSGRRGVRQRGRRCRGVCMASGWRRRVVAIRLSSWRSRPLRGCPSWCRFATGGCWSRRLRSTAVRRI